VGVQGWQAGQIDTRTARYRTYNEDASTTQRFDRWKKAKPSKDQKLLFPE